MAGVVLLAGGAVAAGLFATRGGGARIEAVSAANAVGDTACVSCHQQKETYERTAHRLTSRRPTRQSIQGSFTAGENVLRTSNPYLYFRMDSTRSGFFETAVIGRAPDTTVQSGRIAFVTGLRKGQSFLYWGDDDRLFQLPVSYWEGVGWANSPGYIDGRPNFDRPIPPRCLECHATSFASAPGANFINAYERSGITLGIRCETCHGSGQTHVRHERSPLRAILPTAIVNPARLPRARQLDGCALCHGGATALATQPFTYVPGQQLHKQADLWAARPDTEAVDVHGNQVALLQRSRCFTLSEMTCITCHDVHQQQRDVVGFSEKCLTCHKIESCGLFPQHGQELAGRCVDCHMPTLTSSTVISSSHGEKFRVKVRTHWIKVYPQSRRQ
jgi:hypothetical protein